MVPTHPFTRRGFLRGSVATAGLLTAPRAFAIEGDTLVLRTDGDIVGLDPGFLIGTVDEEICRCLFPSLNRLEAAGSPVPWTLYAATALTAVDPLTIAFTLRDDLRWTGGHGPVTAEDVKYSFERLIDPALEAPNAYAFEALDRVEVTGALSGLIHLKRPFVPLIGATLSSWAGHILSARAMTAAGGKFTTEPPATCGPYRLDHWSPRRSITLVADPDWPGPGPAFAKIRYEIIEDTDAGALAFEAGAVDCARIGLIAYESYRKRLPEGARLMTGPGSRFSFLAINLAHPKLADPRLRRAIQRAVDPAEINLGAYAGLRSVATGVLNATMPGHRDAVLYPPDRAAAKALMVEAGITPLTLHLDILNDPEAALVAQILASQLAAVGITLDVAIHDEAIFWSLGVKADGEDWRGLELVLIEFTGGIDPTENLLSFRPEQIGLYNWGQFDSPDYEKLYQESLIDPDPDRRAALFRRMQDLMEDSGGFVFLTFDSFAAIHRADVAPFVTPENYYDPGRFGRL